MGRNNCQDDIKPMRVATPLSSFRQSPLAAHVVARSVRGIGAHAERAGRRAGSAKPVQGEHLMTRESQLANIDESTTSRSI